MNSIISGERFLQISTCVLLMAFIFSQTFHQRDTLIAIQNALGVASSASECIVSMLFLEAEVSVFCRKRSLLFSTYRKTFSARCLPIWHVWVIFVDFDAFSCEAIEHCLLLLWLAISFAEHSASRTNLTKSLAFFKPDVSRARN